MTSTSSTWTAQEETSRILIVVEDKGTSVADAVRAIHSTRTKIHGEMTQGKIWLNGSLVDWDDAKIHVLTHGLRYATGVFEGLRSYKTVKGNAIFRLSDHAAIDRQC